MDRVVREEAAEHILAGDEVNIPLLREYLSARFGKKVIDILRLDVRTPEHEVLKETMETLRERNLQSDAEKVRLMLYDYCGGLALVGFSDTAIALEQARLMTCCSVLRCEKYTIIFSQRPFRGKTLLAL